MFNSVLSEWLPSSSGCCPCPLSHARLHPRAVVCGRWTFLPWQCFPFPSLQNIPRSFLLVRGKVCFQRSWRVVNGTFSTDSELPCTGAKPPHVFSGEFCEAGVRSSQAFVYHRSWYRDTGSCCPGSALGVCLQHSESQFLCL